jgi:hypothetical protein
MKIADLLSLRGRKRCLAEKVRILLQLIFVVSLAQHIQNLIFVSQIDSYIKYRNLVTVVHAARENHSSAGQIVQEL